MSDEEVWDMLRDLWQHGSMWGTVFVPVDHSGP